jgi:hypothetical protein
LSAIRRQALTQQAIPAGSLSVVALECSREYLVRLVGVQLPFAEVDGWPDVYVLPVPVLRDDAGAGGAQLGLGMGKRHAQDLHGQPEPIQMVPEAEYEDLPLVPAVIAAQPLEDIGPPADRIRGDMDRGVSPRQVFPVHPDELRRRSDH